MREGWCRAYWVMARGGSLSYDTSFSSFSRVVGAVQEISNVSCLHPLKLKVSHRFLSSQSIPH